MAPVLALGTVETVSGAVDAGLGGTSVFQVVSATGLASPVNPPLVVHGERFKFNIGFMGVVGGRATVSVEKALGTTLLTGDVENTTLLRFIFRIKDRFQSVTDEAGSTVKTHLWQDEPGSKRYREEAFFPDRVVTVERSSRGEKTRNITVGLRPLDPLAALFWLRGQRLQDGDVARSAVFANNRVFDADVRVVCRETVYALGKAWRGIKMVVTFSREGKLVDDASATIWVSDDEYRIPLRGAAHTTYGKVTATLVGR